MQNRLSFMSRNIDHIKEVLRPAPPNIPLPENITEKQKELLKSGWPLHSFDYPVEIFPRLWLSGIAFSDDLPTWCKQNGITHIVNASGKFGRSGYYKTHPNDHNINYLELDMEDVSHCALEPFINNMYSFVYFAYHAKGNILIHCMWGQSRSVTCLVYFIMMYWGIKYDAAIRLIRKLRPSASPNNGFETQLRIIEISLLTKTYSKITQEPTSDNNEKMPVLA